VHDTATSVCGAHTTKQTLILIRFNNDYT